METCEAMEDLQNHTRPGVFSGDDARNHPERILSEQLYLLTWIFGRVILPMKFYWPQMFHPYVQNLTEKDYLMLMSKKNEVSPHVETILFMHMT